MTARCLKFKKLIKKLFFNNFFKLPLSHHPKFILALSSAENLLYKSQSNHSSAVELKEKLK